MWLTKIKIHKFVVNSCDLTLLPTPSRIYHLNQLTIKIHQKFTIQNHESYNFHSYHNYQSMAETTTIKGMRSARITGNSYFTAGGRGSGTAHYDMQLSDCERGQAQSKLNPDSTNDLQLATDDSRRRDGVQQRDGVR